MESSNVTPTASPPKRSSKHASVYTRLLMAVTLVYLLLLQLTNLCYTFDTVGVWSSDPSQLPCSWHVSSCLADKSSTPTFSSATNLDAPTLASATKSIPATLSSQETTPGWNPTAQDIAQSHANETTTTSDSSLPFTWNQDGCQEWPKPQTRPQTLPKVPPTGIAVTLAVGRDDSHKILLELLCRKLPTQLAYFFQPQQLDLLVLLDFANAIVMDKVVDCLELVRVENNIRQWQNADGTTLTTHQYKTKTGQTNVYLSDYEMDYPNYIQQNMTLLEEPMWDCATSFDYVQGNRFPTDQMLHLQLVEQYDYLIKIDLDIEFKTIMPFNIAWDMEQRGALFGHFGEFPNGIRKCTQGIQPVMQDFIEAYSGTTATDWSPLWNKGACSAGISEFERGFDQYHANLIFMKREFFYSEPVRAYGRWMNEYQPGYFKYRWGDQLFWHIAMGMFLGPDFRNYVADYTDMRCRRFTNCWFHWAGGGTNRTNRCQAPGGVFYHGKLINALGQFSGVYPKERSPLMETVYENHYRHDCVNLPPDQ